MALGALKQQRWSHPQYSLVAIRGGKAERKRPVLQEREIPEFIRRQPAAEPQKKAPLPICPRLVICVITLTAILCGVHLVRVSLPESTGQEFAFDFPRLRGVDEQERYINSMEHQERLKLITQVRYVLDIIKTHGKKQAVPGDARRLAESIVVESLRANYDPLFVAAVIKSESTFNRHAVSPVGAQGLMQIMPDTGKYISNRTSREWLGTSKLADPTYNIQLGIAYLKQLEGFFRGNREHALIAYNWGPGNVMKALKGSGEFHEGAVNYAKKILNTHRRWKHDYKSRSPLQLKYAGLDTLA